MTDKTYFSCKKTDLDAEGGKERFIKDAKAYMDPFKSELKGVCVWMGRFESDEMSTNLYGDVTTSYDDLYDHLLSKCRGFALYEEDGKTFVECEFDDGFAKLEGRRLLPDAERRFRRTILERDGVSILQKKSWEMGMFRSDEDSRPLDIDRAKKNMNEMER